MSNSACLFVVARPAAAASVTSEIPFARRLKDVIECMPCGAWLELKSG